MRKLLEGLKAAGAEAEKTADSMVEFSDAMRTIADLKSDTFALLDSADAVMQAQQGLRRDPVSSAPAFTPDPEVRRKIDLEG